MKASFLLSHMEELQKHHSYTQCWILLKDWLDFVAKEEIPQRDYSNQSTKQDVSQCECGGKYFHEGCKLVYSKAQSGSCKCGNSHPCGSIGARCEECEGVIYPAL